MKMNKLITARLASLLLFGALLTPLTSQAVGIENPSFEDGLVGWVPNDLDLVTVSFILVTNDTNFAFGGIPITATHGASYLFLTSGFPETSIVQVVSFPSAGKLSFDVVATSYEEEPGDNNDFFQVTLDDTILYEQSVETLGLMGSDFSHVVFDVGTGTMALKIAAYTGGATYGFPLYGAVDNFQFTPTVPVPPSFALLLSAMLSPFIFRRSIERRCA